jgi:hypothetical protein
MEVSDQLHALAILTPGKEFRVPIGYEDKWAPEPVWALWSKEKFLAGNRTLAVQSDTIPTELSRPLLEL